MINYMGVCTGDHIDIYTAVCKAVCKDNYTAIDCIDSYTADCKTFPVY